MCWNPIVSASFCLLYLCFNFYYYLKKPINWKQYLIFSSFYLIMELFQTFQWLFGQVLEKNPFYDNLYGPNFCPTVNVYYTYVAFILIWLQPVMFAYIGKISYENSFFDKYYYICWAVFGYGMINLFLGSIMDIKQAYMIQNSIYGLSTCTTKGGHGHLGWRFRPIMIDYDTNHFVYLLLCIISFVFYKKDLRILGYGWGIALLITYIIFMPTNIEIASSWCLLSIIANFVIVAKIKK